MKITIDISEDIYNTIMNDVMPDEGQLSAIVTRIYQGVPCEDNSKDDTKQ